MKVKEMIEQLSKLDPDLKVFVNGYEGGHCYAGVGGVDTFYLNVNTAWYYGPHDSCEYTLRHLDGDYETVKGVCISGVD